MHEVLWITCVYYKFRHPGIFAISQEKLTKHSGAERKLEEYLRKKAIYDILASRMCTNKEN